MQWCQLPIKRDCHLNGHLSVTSPLPSLNYATRPHLFSSNSVSSLGLELVLLTSFTQEREGKEEGRGLSLRLGRLSLCVVFPPIFLHLYLLPESLPEAGRQALSPCGGEGNPQPDR